MVKHLDAFHVHKAAKREMKPKATEGDAGGVHDRRATGLLKHVMPAVSIVPCPTGDGSRLKVVKNIKGDILAQMFARGQIEEHQVEAGRVWQRHYDASMIGALKAADTTKEPVDGGGGIPEALSDRVMDAVKALVRADRDLGLEGKYLMIDVLGKGYSIEQAAKIRGARSVLERKFWGKRFRECLDTLAVTYNLADRRLTVTLNSV